ncbi:MAG: MBL fold metallo-hydrolase [Methanomassiliicoccales archaeon]|jgi:glyoxylase-like metal-dependent hydrolase (beta-lactamase superfamily II)
MPVLSIAGMGPDSNIFLVTGEDPFVVDAGTGSNHAKVVAKLRSLLKGTQPNHIILTHRHYDHVGGAPKLSKELDAEVYIHELDASVVETADLRGTAAHFFTSKMEPLKTNHLKGGEVFETGDHRFEVVHTPGHTAGGICLFDRGSGDLISGDTVFVGGVGRWDLESGNHKALVASVKDLINLSPRALYPGHGESARMDATMVVKDALTYLGEF